LLHRYKAWRDFELTTSACNYVVDSDAFANFDQSQTLAFVNLEDSLKTCFDLVIQTNFIFYFLLTLSYLLLYL